MWTGFHWHSAIWPPCGTTRAEMSKNWGCPGVCCTGASVVGLLDLRSAHSVMEGAGPPDRGIGEG